MHWALHPKDDIDRLYVSRKKGEGFANQKIALMHRYNDSKTTLKCSEGD